MPLFEPFPGTLPGFVRIADTCRELTHRFRNPAKPYIRPRGNARKAAPFTAGPPFGCRLSSDLWPTNVASASTSGRSFLAPIRVVVRTNGLRSHDETKCRDESVHALARSSAKPGEACGRFIVHQEYDDRPSMGDSDRKLSNASVVKSSYCAEWPAKNWSQLCLSQISA